jgi:RNA polymerase sigma-70 factor (ECF subfamily)
MTSVNAALQAAHTWQPLGWATPMAFTFPLSLKNDLRKALVLRYKSKIMRPELQKMTDRQLLDAYAARRDLHAFEAFVSRHEGALLAFAAGYLRCEATAQDVVQEVFLRVARSPGRVLNCEAAGERNWLFKIVRDLSVDCLRRQAVERKAAKELAAAPPATAPAPDILAEGAEHLAAVRAAIDRLKPRLRELLLLKISEGKSYREIAAITGLSVTNVGFLLHQALVALEAELKE